MDLKLYGDLTVISSHANGNPEDKFEKALKDSEVDPEKNPEEIAALIDYIGVDIPKEYLEIYHANSKKAKTEAEREGAKKAAEKAQEITKQIKQNLSSGIDLKSPEYSKALSDLSREVDKLEPPDNLQKLTARLLFSFPKSSPVKIDFLDWYAIPSSGIVTIGGKTGGGKTTFMINTCRVYLNHMKKIVFITYELNGQDIALALALSLYAEMKTETIPGWDRTHDGPGRRIYSLDEIKQALPAIPADENPDFVDTFDMIKQYIAENGEPPSPLKLAYEIIVQAIDSDRLVIIESPRDALEVERVINITNADVYFVDYIQVIPPPPDISRDSYRSIQAVCDIFRKLGNKNRNLIFLGAQFNRQAGDETQRGNFDPRLEQFREAGDIEQVSTLAIGIGYQIEENGKKQFFYKMLKNRFAGRMTGAKICSRGYFEYFYAMRGGRWTPSDKWHTPSTPRKLQRNQLIIIEIIKETGSLAEKSAQAEFKERTGKTKYDFTRTLKSLIKRGSIKNDNGILSCE